jgi:hypothetical protein
LRRRYGFGTMQRCFADDDGSPILTTLRSSSSRLMRIEAKLDRIELWVQGEDSDE